MYGNLEIARRLAPKYRPVEGGDVVEPRRQEDVAAGPAGGAGSLGRHRRDRRLLHRRFVVDVLPGAQRRPVRGRRSHLPSRPVLLHLRPSGLAVCLLGRVRLGDRRPRRVERRAFPARGCAGGPAPRDRVQGSGTGARRAEDGAQRGAGGRGARRSPGRRSRLRTSRGTVHRGRRGLPAQGLEHPLFHFRSGVRRRLHRRPRAPAPYPHAHGGRLPDRRGAHLQRRAWPAQTLASAGHRGVGGRAHRPSGHRAGGLAGACGEPEPVDQRGSLHRQRHRGHSLGVCPDRDQ